LIWTNRSRTRTIFEVLGSRNIAVWAITAGTILFLGATLYVPWARDLFQFSILHPDDVAMCVLLALASVTWFEAAKVLRRAKPWARS